MDHDNAGPHSERGRLRLEDVEDGLGVLIVVDVALDLIVGSEQARSGEQPRQQESEHLGSG
jgi:hypothetical protein